MRLDRWRRSEARRRAKEEALLNALRTVLRIDVTDDAVLGELAFTERRGFLVSLMQEHSVESERWMAGAAQPHMEVTVSVPLWGRGLLAEAVQREVVREAAAPTDAREPAKRLGTVQRLVVDARGVGIRPVMFPEIVEPGGEVLFNAKSLRAGRSTNWGPIQYVTTDADASAIAPRGPRRGRYVYVRARAASDEQDPRLVLSEDAAFFVLDDAMVQALLRRGLVTIIVDAARDEQEQEQEQEKE